jgi:integrase
MTRNPITATDPVAYEKREARTFTPEQARRFLAMAEQDRLGALFTIALSLGLRKGEVCGLKFDDLDLEGRVLRVRRSLSWIKDDEGRGQWLETPPKRGSRRDLRITDTIQRMLLAHLARRAAEAARAGERWRGSVYLFVSPTGAPLHERNVSEAFYALCDRAKVPRIRFHDTRHSCGTLLHVQGADPFTIAKVLGHSQLSTTRRYTEVPMSVTTTAIERLESLIGTVPQDDQGEP